MLVSGQSQDELRVAIVQDRVLVDFDIERPDVEEKKSNIYKGRISSIEPSLNAVFVDYGSERHGFLPLKEISREYFQTNNEEQLKNPDIQKILKIGQEIVIQVDKEERGTKGAALTTFITLAGSFLVLMPNNPRAGGISRRIEGDERDHLRELLNGLEIPEGMGVIIRTAGVNRSVKELQWDLSFLLRYWDAIIQATSLKKGPYLIHQESDVIIRAIRDNLRQDISEIIIDEPEAFERAKNYLQQIRPDFVDNIKLYQDTLPLFSRFQVERQIEMAYQREVQLPSGGSIVIDHTEALVSIDINSARATKGSNIEETAHQTNLEAAEEIARQLRIRDNGGLIVIDFIDMMQSKNQRDVENKLRECLQMDRARIQIGRISRFGLLEMSRQRLRSSLTRSIHVPCPRCDGQGTIRGVESLAHSIVYLIQEQAVKTGGIQIQVQVPIDVATYILNEKRIVITDIQKETGCEVLIIPNQYLESPQYSIKHLKIDIVGKSPSSFKLVKFPKTDGTTTQKTKISKSIEEPAINEFLSSNAPKAAPTKASTSNGLIKRMWDIMFGGSANTPNNKSNPSTQKPRKPAQKKPHENTQQRNPEFNRQQQRSSQPNDRKPKQQHERRNGQTGNRRRQSNNQNSRHPGTNNKRQAPKQPTETEIKPIEAKPQVATTPTQPPKKPTATPQANLVTQPSPLEKAQSTMQQVKTSTSDGQSQADIQRQAQQQSNTKHSELRSKPEYKGLGGNESQLQQVKTKDNN